MLWEPSYSNLGILLDQVCVTAVRSWSLTVLGAEHISKLGLERRALLMEHRALSFYECLERRALFQEKRAGAQSANMKFLSSVEQCIQNTVNLYFLQLF